MPVLRGSDAGFLYSETALQPVSIPTLFLLGPRDEADLAPLTFEQLRDHVGRRLDIVPALRWKLARFPLGLHRPFFVDDPDFDLDFHLRHTVLPAPGGTAELDRLIADGAERLLDRRHPLWQLTLVDGLADGRQALSFRAHHCLFDGAALLTTCVRLFAEAGVTAAERRQADELAATVPPAGRVRRALAREAAADQWRGLRRLPALVADTKRRLDAVKAREAASPIPVPALTKDTPVCSVNDAFSNDRTYARAMLSMTDVKRVRRVGDVSVTAVLLAVAGAGLRTYLQAHDDLPERPLTANLPIGTDEPGAPARLWGNGFANHLATLATDEADPWVRLQTISTVVEESRRRLEILGTDTIVRWLDYIPSALGEWGGRRMGEQRREHPDKIDFSVLVSNVPGSAERLVIGSMQVEEIYVSGPTTDGEGVNITYWSTGDDLALAVLAHAEAMPDPTELTTAMVDALAELVAVAGERQGPHGPDAVAAAMPGGGG